MGYEAACTLRLGRQTSNGKAVLEQNDLIFRGPTRLAIPLKEIASAVARDGALTVRFGKKTAVFEIGSAAARWADRITDPPSRLDKLGVKSGMRIVLTGTAHADLIEEIKGRGAHVSRTAPPVADSWRRAADGLPAIPNHRDSMALSLPPLLPY